MSLTNILRGSVETIYTVLEELVVLATYHSTSTARIYDAETDSYAGGAADIPNVRVIETSVSVEEREASPVTVEDTKILIPHVDLASITLEESDTITYNGTTKNILARKKIPGKAIHVFFVRER